MRLISALMIVACASACGARTEAASLPSPEVSVLVADAEPAAAPSPPKLAVPMNVAPPGPIPSPYRKTWAVNAADCAGAPGPTRISIDPATITFKGGRYDVVNFEENGSHELLLQVTRIATSPPTKETHILRINDNGTLSYQRGSATQIYHVCGA